MPYQVSCYDTVLTVRIDGRCNPQELYLELRSALDNQSAPVIAILDLTLAASFDQQLKSMFYRALQHHYVAAVGICGVNAMLAKDVDDVIPVLRRIRRVVVAETDSDVRAELGLTAPIEPSRKLTGMLAYLKKP